MKKILAMLLVLTMILSLGAISAFAADEVTLDVIISEYGSYTREWWDGVFIPKFEEANPDIKLNLEVVSWNDLDAVVNTRISTGQQPDILNFNAFADFVADDLLMPAEEYASEELQAKFFPDFWTANTMDGTIWALPILASARGLYYNKDILEAAGVEVPTTWAEVKDACAKIKEYDPDIIPWSLDISNDEGQAAFSYYTWNNGGGFLDADGNWALNSTENVEAMTFMKELIDAGYVWPEYATATRYPQQDAFAAGSVAMIIGPNNLYDIAADVNFGVASIPANEGKDPVNMGVCDVLVAFADEDAEEGRTEAISKFFDFFYDTDLYSEYMVYEGFLPVTADSAALLAENAEQFKKGGPDGGEGNSEYFANFNEVLASCEFYPTYKVEWSDVMVAVTAAEQQIAEGADIQETLDAAQAEIVG